jgi:conjugative transfer signal peptidase TraF
MSRNIRVIIFILSSMIFCGGVWYTYTSVKQNKQIVYYNATASFPKGLYKRKKQKFDYHGRAIKNELIILCGTKTEAFKAALQRRYLRPSTKCNNKAQRLLKRVHAVQGDVITMNEEGLWVNGKWVQNSKPLKYDSSGRKMLSINMRNKYLVKDNEIWVMAEYAKNSFDSRYFGLIPTKHIIDVVEPWLVRK